MINFTIYCSFNWHQTYRYSIWLKLSFKKFTTFTAKSSSEFFGIVIASLFKLTFRAWLLSWWQNCVDRLRGGTGFTDCNNKSIKMLLLQSYNKQVAGFK